MQIAEAVSSSLNLKLIPSLHLRSHTRSTKVMKFKLHITIAALVAVTATLVVAQAQQDTKPQLPPGMTEADMRACAEAGTPGPQHQRLAENVGVWQGKSTMWMTPG